MSLIVNNSEKGFGGKMFIDLHRNAKTVDV
jgi:hypothetical protein